MFVFELRVMRHNEGAEILTGAEMAKLQVDIPDDLKQWLKIQSVVQGETMSEIVKVALEQYKASIPADKS